MPYTEGQITKFPEMPRQGLQGDEKPSYIGSSDAMPAGHANDDVNVRMSDPFSDPYSYDAEPRGSAPQSGEGINAPNKPQGAGLEPENSDYY